MTVSMIATHAVADWDAWRTSYYGDGIQIRAQFGVLNESVHRDLADPLLVTVYHQFADEDGARAFTSMMTGPEFQALSDEVGIDLTSLDVKLVSDVE